MSREFYVTSKATSRLRNDMAADRQQSGGMKNHHIHNTHRDQRKISEKKNTFTCNLSSAHVWTGAVQFQSRPYLRCHGDGGHGDGGLGDEARDSRQLGAEDEF